MRKRFPILALLVVGWMSAALPARAKEMGKTPGRLAADFDPEAKYEFGGPVGRRIEVNTRNWLLRAPGANPGLLGMFQLRDRRPTPGLVPWAGEFVGKYLISAIQGLRMSDDEELERTVAAVVEDLIASQADDGYLGPFPEDTRLLANWDLWGHYHCMLALMMWHERTGDSASLETCVRVADLICKTYLDTDRRMREAGSTEMNLAVIHALGRLHRVTGEPRYLRMMREIEKDWEREGDYFRTAMKGLEFYRTPKPRWESLHNIQGLVELFLITGDNRYRRAFLHHWDSIRRLDRRNTGGFTSGERATGTPYEPTPIETCCTIAWMALTVDALRLSGDPAAADELERSTYNGMLGAQHPSGSWWTYNTPMGGVREASGHSIVFQARAGTPELNCCSVNAPRGLGMLSEWAVTRAGDGLAINYLGPMRVSLKLADGTPVAIHQETTYPLQGDIRVRVELDRPTEFALKLRIPAWARGAKVRPPGAQWTDAPAGTYFVIRRRWSPDDEVRLALQMPLRHESGDGPMFGRMCVYRGPILLAYDVARNDFDEEEAPRLTPDLLRASRVVFPEASERAERSGRFSPWMTVEIPCGNGKTLRLCDFATAGSLGSRYQSWLPADEIRPPTPVVDRPTDGAGVPSGRIRFTWRRSASADAG
ncbi:MAG: beta-L-arabinofuranosidase domain-containing protein, partial [Thermoguttaceae bacterium]